MFQQGARPGLPVCKCCPVAGLPLLGRPGRPRGAQSPRPGCCCCPSGSAAALLSRCWAGRAGAASRGGRVALWRQRARSLSLQPVGRRNTVTKQICGMVLFLELLVLKVGKTEEALSSQADPFMINNRLCECSHPCVRYCSRSRSCSQGLGTPLAQWGAERGHTGPSLSGYRGVTEPASRSLDISLASASARRSLEKGERPMDLGSRKAPPPLTKCFAPYSGSACSKAFLSNWRPPKGLSEAPEGLWEPLSAKRHVWTSPPDFAAAFAIPMSRARHCL